MHTNQALKGSPGKFIVLVMIFSIPLWLTGVFVHKGLPLPVNLPVSSLMGFCPLFAALILVHREDKPHGMRKLLIRLFAYKGIKPYIWYLPIFFLMPFVMLLSYWTMRWIGLSLPQPHIPLLLIPGFFVMYLIEAIGEEAGWTGYAVDPLQNRWSAIQTGVTLGVVWAIWHIIGYLQLNHTLIWILGQCLFTIAARVLMVWLYNNTGGSVLSAILFHTMVNVSWSMFPNYGSHYNPMVTGFITVIVAVFVTYLWGADTLARYRYARPSSV